MIERAARRRDAGPRRRSSTPSGRGRCGLTQQHRRRARAARATGVSATSDPAVVERAADHEAQSVRVAAPGRSRRRRRPGPSVDAGRAAPVRRGSAASGRRPAVGRRRPASVVGSGPVVASPHSAVDVGCVSATRRPGRDRSQRASVSGIETGAEHDLVEVLARSGARRRRAPAAAARRRRPRSAGATRAISSCTSSTVLEVEVGAEAAARARPRCASRPSRCPRA